MTSLTKEQIDTAIQAAQEDGASPQAFLRYVVDAWDTIATERLAHHRETWQRALTAATT